MNRYYEPTEDEMRLIQCTDYLGNMSAMPLPSEHRKDWTLISKVVGDKLLTTPFPDHKVLRDGIGQTTHAGLLPEDEQWYTAADGGIVNSNFFVDSLRRSIRKTMKPTQSGPGQTVAPRTVKPNWDGGRQIEMTIGTLWTPAYKAELKVSLLGPGSGASHKTYKYPGRSRTLELTDGGVARGTWPAYDPQDGVPVSAIQKSLDTLKCTAHKQVLDEAMTYLDSWTPEIPRTVLSARSKIIPCWNKDGEPTQAEITLAVSIAKPADKSLLAPLIV